MKLLLNTLRDLGRAIGFGYVPIALRYLAEKLFGKNASSGSAPAPDPPKKNSRRKRFSSELKLNGWTFGPIFWNLLIIPAINLAASVLLVGTITLIERLGYGLLSDGWIFTILTVLSSMAIYLSVGEQVVVPTAHVAVITFLNQRSRIYLTEGYYFRAGIPPLVSFSQEVKKEFTDSKGFVYIGDRQLPIWNASDERGKTILNVVARDSSTIFVNLLIVVRVIDPYLILSSGDPALDIADRARAALRNAIAFITAEDAAAIKSILSELMSGKVIIACFTNKQVESYAQYSMVQTAGGAYLYEVISPESDLEKVKATFRDRVEAEANRQMLEAIPKDARGKVMVEARSVDTVLDPVAAAAGTEVVRATISNITLSKALQEAADAASAEMRQRVAQLASAATQAEAAKLLHEGTKDMGDLAIGIAAAADNPNVKVTVVATPGGHKLTQGLVAAATQIGGGKA